ncbi:hypothetical protein L5515_012790 [Caenorhabditis briggsae]|uniref:Uncharacterized protein n=1 Tax=Caenorhabditis briggsae TaxID=6238 RepID=A0AAE9IKS1_CAEBR|nr:hypothetical protein L3Y34_005707 [Caenorhabditis briggsae]UMM31224.1 hypothetical protein L5515_012790 [Caenorhabditis briggsae]
MLFYKALLAILASTAVVWALPVLGDSNGLLNGLTGKLNGALGNTPLGNLNIAELIDLDELLELLEMLKEIKKNISLTGELKPELEDVVDDGEATIEPDADDNDEANPEDAEGTTDASEPNGDLTTPDPEGSTEA